MARKPDTAPAEQSATPEPIPTARRIRSVDRDGMGYPAVEMTGEPPRKNSTFRFSYQGQTYSGKAVSHEEAPRGGILIHTEGLEPEAGE